MGKQILILSGSPRKGGNSDTLAQEFARTAGAAGHTVSIFRAADHKVGPCVACDRCWTKDGLPCVQKDDMQELYKQLNLADAVVFASPVYYFTFPAQLKLVIDRFYPLSKDDKADAFADKQCALIVCGGSDDEADYDPVIQTYEVLTDYLGWEDCGIVTATGLDEAGKAAGSEWMEAVRDLARSF